MNDAMERLLTCGYANKNDVRRLEMLMDMNPLAKIVDIRFSPRCRWSALWTRQGLEQRWGSRYFYRGDWLGNRAYATRDQMIQLALPEHGIPWILHQLEEGFILILLCACSNYQTCHRKVVVELVRERIDAGALEH